MLQRPNLTDAQFENLLDFAGRKGGKAGPSKAVRRTPAAQSCTERSAGSERL
jgi:hypothetical protein